jgi:hypothetical protein
MVRINRNEARHLASITDNEIRRLVIAYLDLFEVSEAQRAAIWLRIEKIIKTR